MFKHCIANVWQEQGCGCFYKMNVTKSKLKEYNKLLPLHWHSYLVGFNGSWLKFIYFFFYFFTKAFPINKIIFVTFSTLFQVHPSHPISSVYTNKLINNHKSVNGANKQTNNSHIVIKNKQYISFNEQSPWKLSCKITSLWWMYDDRRSHVINWKCQCLWRLHWHAQQRTRHMYRSNGII